MTGIGQALVERLGPALRQTWPGWWPVRPRGGHERLGRDRQPVRRQLIAELPQHPAAVIELVDEHDEPEHAGSERALRQG